MLTHRFYVLSLPASGGNSALNPATPFVGEECSRAVYAQCEVCGHQRESPKRAFLCAPVPPVVSGPGKIADLASSEHADRTIRTLLARSQRLLRVGVPGLFALSKVN